MFRLFAFLLSCSCMFCPGSVAKTERLLVIRDTASRQILWARQVEQQDSFSLRWIHSIHGTPVEEQFVIDRASLVMVRMSFADYGIGMDSQLQPGERLVNQNGRFVVEGMNRRFPSLSLFVGQVKANHTLLFDGGMIPLRDLARLGASLTIRVEQASNQFPERRVRLHEPNS